MNTLFLRVISAAGALAVLCSTYYFFHVPGLQVLGFIVAAGGVFEFHQIAFKQFNIPRRLSCWFLFVCFALMSLALYLGPINLGLIWAILIPFYFAVALWMLRGQMENRNLLEALSFSALGFVYCALLPTFALLLLNLPNGEIWFLFLIGLVFGGDISAYFGGILFGKEKLMPLISPNKTIAGAVAGAIGSVAIGSVIGVLGLKTAPPFFLVGISLAGSLLAQSGDLFESLLKRVASVKDSGQFMPGHGGILDRLDGIYFVAPLVYCAAVVSGAL